MKFATRVCSVLVLLNLSTTPVVVFGNEQVDDLVTPHGNIRGRRLTRKTGTSNTNSNANSNSNSNSNTNSNTNNQVPPPPPNPPVTNANTNSNSNSNSHTNNQVPPPPPNPPVTNANVPPPPAYPRKNSANMRPFESEQSFNNRMYDKQAQQQKQQQLMRQREQQRLKNQPVNPFNRPKEPESDNELLRGYKPVPKHVPEIDLNAKDSYMRDYNNRAQSGLTKAAKFVDKKLFQNARDDEVKAMGRKAQRQKLMKDAGNDFPETMAQIKQAESDRDRMMRKFKKNNNDAFQKTSDFLSAGLAKAATHGQRKGRDRAQKEYYKKSEEVAKLYKDLERKVAQKKDMERRGVPFREDSVRNNAQYIEAYTMNRNAGQLDRLRNANNYYVNENHNAVEQDFDEIRRQKQLLKKQDQQRKQDEFVEDVKESVIIPMATEMIANQFEPGSIGFQLNDIIGTEIAKRAAGPIKKQQNDAPANTATANDYGEKDEEVKQDSLKKNQNNNAAANSDDSDIAIELDGAGGNSDDSDNNNGQAAVQANDNDAAADTPEGFGAEGFVQGMKNGQAAEDAIMNDIVGHMDTQGGP